MFEQVGIMVILVIAAIVGYNKGLEKLKNKKKS